MHVNSFGLITPVRAHTHTQTHTHTKTHKERIHAHAHLLATCLHTYNKHTGHGGISANGAQRLRTLRHHLQHPHKGVREGVCF